MITMLDRPKTAVSKFELSVVGQSGKKITCFIWRNFLSAEFGDYDDVKHSDTYLNDLQFMPDQVIIITLSITSCLVTFFYWRYSLL